MGPWFAFSDAISPNDGLSSDSPCVLAGHPVSACSKVLTPTPGTAFVPTNLASGMMCTTGVAAKAVDVVGQVGIPDYSNIYGGGIGMNFNELQGATNRAAFNFSAAHVVGISFDIDQVPSGGIRVELPTTSTVQSPAIYQPNSVANYISPLQTGHNQIRWNQAIYPDYVVNPPLFDPTQLLAVAFHVATSSVGPVSYAFCISNLSAIVGP
jgi:hypothetical protein